MLILHDHPILDVAQSIWEAVKRRECLIFVYNIQLVKSVGGIFWVNPYEFGLNIFPIRSG